jgi:dTDP-4-amino-4,6-dideoxygalactose transaminase
LNKPLFSPWPSFSDEERSAVNNVLLSNQVNYWTGDECRKFEAEFAAWVGVDYGVALANGTAALESALHAIGIGQGDEVIVTPRTFIASVSCIVNAGAIPVFVDVDLESGNITADNISKGITKKTKAIICVHMAGWPCDMDRIMLLAEKHNICVIEDCAQAHGAKYKDRFVGGLGHIACWSFCQDKIITTGGEGGMVTTNKHEWWSKIWSYKDHGKSWEAVYKKKQSTGFQWVHNSFGTNLRMTEMQAAIGRIQLKKISEWNIARNNHAKAILQVCEQFPGKIRATKPPQHVVHAWYKCHVFINPQHLKSGWSREKILEEIVSSGVPSYAGSCSEVYLEQAFDSTGYRPSERLKNAKYMGETSLMFLVHPTLTKQEIDKTCEVIIDIAKKAFN